MSRVKGIIMLALVVALAVALPGYVLYKSAPMPVVVENIELSAMDTIPVLGSLNDGTEGTDLAAVHAAIEGFLARNPNATRVDLVIDSGGGLHTPATLQLFSYMDYLVSRGVAVRCTVAGVAASLAAALFSHCSERYAVSSAVIMVHGVMIIGAPSMNAVEALELSNYLESLDDAMWEPLKDLINDSDYWDRNFAAERLMPATELAMHYPNVLTIIRSITLIP